MWSGFISRYVHARLQVSVCSSNDLRHQWCMQDFVMEAVEQAYRAALWGRKGRKRGWGCGHPTVSYISNASNGVFCCILEVFCTIKLCAVQRGKGSVRLLEAMWNSNCYSTLHQVQPVNAQTRHYSYTPASTERTCCCQRVFLTHNLLFGTPLCTALIKSQTHRQRQHLTSLYEQLSQLS